MINLAILDMYKGKTNLGINSIKDLINQRFSQIQYHVFDVRGAAEVPDESFDIYISSGGPGHPLDEEEIWGESYYKLLDKLLSHNANSADKKYIFFICHSFQIASQYFGIGKISRRPRPSFGIFPVRKTLEGFEDQIFKYLPDPFCAADFRKYQILRPNLDRVKELNGEILALEHESRLPHSDLAVMAFRIGEAIYGTQFHPEAYPEGMLSHISKPDRREQIIEDHGATTYESMLFQLRDPIKLSLTFEEVLPQFLKYAAKAISSAAVSID